eukprot:TRINITY_DN694_c2_g1_i4.p1 TRINITY_DN694_c2_g1~~TRINITY_DN694_c2_g1_i4.p1  ORF type:complete len:821 (+),score=265.16 TRINITY_DN694_c2_g1_i4:466-2928(+)
MWRVALWWVRLRCWGVATAMWFERLIILLISANVTLLCMQHYRQPDLLTDTVVYSNYGFLIAFTIEAAVKATGFGGPAYLGDPWNRFDLFLVVVGWSSYGAGGPALHAARVLRVGRMLRLIKGARQVTKLGETLLYALPALGNVALLLLIVYFIFGIAGVELFGSVKTGNQATGLNAYANFRNVAYAMVTLYQVGTTEGWVDIMRDTSIDPETSDCTDKEGNCGHQPTAVAYFLLFMLLGSFVMLQLFATIVLSEWESQQEDDKDTQDVHLPTVEVEQVTFTSAAEMLHVIRTQSDGLLLTVDGAERKGRSKEVKVLVSAGQIELLDIGEKMVVPKCRRVDVFAGLKHLCKQVGATHNIPDSIPAMAVRDEEDEAEVPQWLPVEPASLFGADDGGAAPEISAWKRKEFKRRWLSRRGSAPLQGYICTKYFDVVGGLAKLKTGQSTWVYEEMSESSRGIRWLSGNTSVRVHQVQTQMLKTGMIRAADKLRLLGYFRSMWQKVDPSATGQIPVRQFLLLLRTWWLLRESLLAADELWPGARVQVLNNDDHPQARGMIGRVAQQFDKFTGQRVAHRDGRVLVKLQPSDAAKAAVWNQDSDEIVVQAAHLRLCTAGEDENHLVPKSVSALRTQRRATAARDRRESMARVGVGRADMTDLFILQLLRVLPVPVSECGSVLYVDAVQALSKQLFNVDPEHAHALQQVGAVRSRQWAHVDCRMVTHHFALQKIRGFVSRHRRLRDMRGVATAGALAVCAAAAVLGPPQSSFQIDVKPPTPAGVDGGVSAEEEEDAEGAHAQSAGGAPWSCDSLADFCGSPHQTFDIG